MRHACINTGAPGWVAKHSLRSRAPFPCLQAPFHRVKDIFANNDAFVTARRSSSGHGRSSGGRSLAASRSLSRQSTLESAARLRPALSDVPLRSPSLLGSMRRPSLDVGASGAGDAAKAKSLFERLAHL